ncbi:MAG: DUF4349 domain-containing protein [Candidatus Dojkabacteria bacterium]|nr:DUF4349 domain-containing protein [Candidatus Dojkabacteria bacterium]
MSLSKQTKKVLIIISISIGILLILSSVIYGISILFKTSNEYSLSESFSGIAPEEISYSEDTDSSKTLELDANNYDEANTDTKIRKSGSIYITVDDLDIANDSIMNVLDMYNGSIVSSSETGEDNDKTLTITLKMPVEYFEDVYQDVQDIDGEITYASYYTDDITQEYTDLESRLRNLEATEEQLVKILGTATTVDDTLAVYEQLTSIRSQIEVIKGQLQYLDNQVDYSYLTVSLSLSDVGKDIADEQWKPLGVIKNAFSSLVSLGIAFVDFLIWVIVFSPVIAIVVLVIVLLRIRAKNKK